MPLTQKQAVDLLVKSAHSSNPAQGARWCDRGGTVHHGKPPADQVGRMEGRTGTKRRSRKGAVTTLPNGSRSYIAGGMTHLDEYVLWYKV